MTTPPTPSRLDRLGRWSARRPGRVVLLWLLALAAVLGASRVISHVYNDSVSISGTPAATGAALLAAHEPTTGVASGTVVLAAPHGTLAAHQAAVAQTRSRLAALPDVLAVGDPLAPGATSLSRDGSIGYLTVSLSTSTRSLPNGFATSLQTAVAPARADGLRAAFGGGFDQVTRPKVSDRRSEAIGLVVAAVVLAIVFGSVLGALVPLVTAVVAVLLALSALGLLAAALSFGTAAPTLAAMIGLGVGIDYALFLTTRFRQLVMDGVDPVEGAGRVTASSGHAVLTAAATVAVAMLGLYGSGVTFIGQLGLAAVVGVATSALAAVTLVPAMLGWLGTRVDRLAVRRPVAEGGDETDGWRRYAARLERRPVRYLLLGVLALLVLAIPTLSLRTGHVSDGTDPTTFSDRQAYDLITTGFGPGANGPLTVVLDVRHAHGVASLAAVAQRDLAATADVASVSPARPSPDGALEVLTVVPRSGPADAATPALVSRLTGTVLPRVVAGTGATAYVTGATASQIQFDGVVTSRTPLIMGIVIALAVLLILSAFRSLALALEAAVVNLLSIGAAYGVVVAVFQWGWGRSLLGVSQSVPVEAYVPMMMFAIVFGLSMDYEVFLLARVREAWGLHREAGRAVTDGLAHTGRVISAAATIMISVFLSFVTSDLVVVKQLAVGLAASVAIDATLVRLLLVPTTMFLLGERNWWIPRWLDRVLPRLDVEGGAP